MNIIDWIILGWTAYLILRGWSQGWLRSLIGPFSLILSLIIAYQFHQHGHGLTKAFLIASFGPILFPWILGFIFKWCNKRFCGDSKPNVMSRFLGVGISVLWGSLFWMICAALLLILPSGLPGLTKAQTALRSSTLYKTVEPAITPFLPQIKIQKPRQPVISLSPGSFHSTMAEKPEVQALMNHPKMQAVLEDPEIAQAIEEGQYHKLLTHAKFRELTQDEDLLKDVMAVYTSFFKSALPPEESPKSIPQESPAP